MSEIGTLLDAMRDNERALRVALAKSEDENARLARSHAALQRLAGQTGHCASASAIAELRKLEGMPPWTTT